MKKILLKGTALYKANMLNLTMINDESLIFTHAHCRSSVDR